MPAVFAGLIGLGLITGSVAVAVQAPTCDSVQNGYQCQTDISHNWGQYSPYFSVPSEICADIPPTCSVSFVQILSRHGARNPTTSKTAAYAATIAQIHSNVSASAFTGEYAFLATYNYTLGANSLTVFGQNEMVNSGIKFYRRYENLANHIVPFVRSSSEARVVESAQNWTQGFAQAKSVDWRKTPGDPVVDVVILEAPTSNNTLNHETCTAFEDGPDSEINDNAEAIWADVFIKPIQDRLNTALPGASLSTKQTVYMMDLCPFNTVASPTGAISPFCALFTAAEWEQYGYYETLNKFYGFGTGNPLGPSQGIGWVNELLARLTNTVPVPALGSVNTTLDTDPETFPLGRTLYADFSHDDDLTAIFFALGLYGRTGMLTNTTLETPAQTGGYSAAWTVPFAARAYVEKLRCAGHAEELVRVVVNDRVVPLVGCGADALGRCSLSAFVASQAFARRGGDFAACFA
ncbi:hypothetical protein MBLNU459_g4032t1 [Dothideomycetes sp. NU459]